MRKTDDNTKTYFRAADRIAQQNGEWYFQTREGARGPFVSREAAAHELKGYIDTMNYIEANESKLPSEVDWTNVTLVDIEAPSF